ncbi:MAG: methionyl-tRNA formyltransferase [Gammaproteobacteria bacterium]|nr:methionyl-tRNA formyltransferase [Gammaproteobacteria bacterium]MDH5630116.1 methionyl-tRNA formyltransferase [Gammaproteobacteria bacterium]
MSSNQLRLIFAGTPDFAAKALETLLEQKFEIAAVYCQPDRPSGRGKKIVFGPVKQLAIENNVPVEQPANFKSEEAINRLKEYQADIMIVAAYGLILPEAVLNTPKYGCINIHASLLPRWRGAAPIHRAIEAGDEETGITIMKMDKGLDTGNMLLKKKIKIENNDIGSTLHDKLSVLGGSTICEYLNIFDIENTGEKQNSELVTYAAKLSKEEARIDWEKTAEEIERKVRAFNAWPVSYTFLDNNKIRVWQVLKQDEVSDKKAGYISGYNKTGIDVVCGDKKVLKITKLQVEGGKPMSVADFLNGRQQWLEKVASFE